MGNTHITERRRHRLFGISFSIPLPWILTIIVIGLVQFGIFFERFQTFAKKIEEVIAITADTNRQLTIVNEHDKEQDRRLESIERRR